MAGHLRDRRADRRLRHSAPIRCQFPATSDGLGSGTPPAGAPSTAAAPTAPLPIIETGVVGHDTTYRGIKPKVLYFSGDSTNILEHLTWPNWTATGATGHGLQEINNCVPDCASAKAKNVPATITLSAPVNGHFTVLTETYNGTTLTVTPSKHACDSSGRCLYWPQHAS